jgi:hypothetical protein
VSHKEVFTLHAHRLYAGFDSLCSRSSLDGKPDSEEAAKRERQFFDLQHDALLAAGIDLERIYKDRASGKSEDRPLALHDIDDRRNELSGNVSLNQELTFIQAVNEWVREDKERTGFAKTHKEIDIYMITMAKQLTDSLDLGSKFNRDPAFVSDLRQHGNERGAEFLNFWSTAEEHELETIKWPTRALEGIQVCKSQRIAQRVPELPSISEALVA